MKKITLANKSISAFHDEYNISWCPPDSRMNNEIGMVFDALSMISIVNAGATGSMAWNEADGNYGKLEGWSPFNKRASANLYNIFNSDMKGTVVTTTVSDSSKIAVMAVKSGTWRKIAIVNRSEADQTVQLTITGASSNVTSGSSYTVKQALSWGLNYTSITHGTLTSATGLSLPSNSVAILVMDEGSLPPAGGTTLFSTGFESGNTAPTWNDTVDWGTNVGGYCCGLTAMESSTRNETTHTGSTALMYSGNDQSATTSYSYNKVFDVNIPIASNTQLTYWIYPQQTNGTYVAIDFIFTDGTNLRDSGVVDQNGVRLHPTFQGNGGKLAVNSWNQVTARIGSVSSLVGKTIDRILVAYDQPGNTGQFRGFIDDIAIENK